MRTFIINCAIIAAFISVPLQLCYAVSVAKKVQKGNRLYEKGKFDEALKYYNEAQKNEPDSSIINFNIGTAWYKKGNYKKAIDFFVKSLTTERKKLESKANYNIANAKYKMGKRKINTDLSDTIKLYREALDYYKRAIDLDEKNIDAKYNHEFVEKELKVLLDRLKKNQSQQAKNNKEKQEETNKKVSSQEKKSTKSDEGKQNKKEKSVPSQVKQSLKDTTQKKESNKNDNENLAQKEFQENKKEMTEKEARMLLRRYSYKETPLTNFNKETAVTYYPPVEKDW